MRFLAHALVERRLVDASDCCGPRTPVREEESLNLRSIEVPATAWPRLGQSRDSNESRAALCNDDAAAGFKNNGYGSGGFRRDLVVPRIRMGDQPSPIPTPA